MRYDAVFFDLDGTVIDTLQNITNAVNHTTAHFGLGQFAPETLKPHLGWGVDHLMRCLIPGLSQVRLAELMAYYRPYYARHTTEDARPYEGILPLLRQLRDRGLALALISNKPDSAVQPLAELYFRDLLSYAVGELPGVARKPAPDMLQRAARTLGVDLSRCVYVGDSEVDLQTAANAGIDCLCVSWGFRTRQQLLEAGARQIAERPEDLVPMIIAPET